MPVQERSAFSSASLRDGLRPLLTGARAAFKNLPRRNGEKDAIASFPKNDILPSFIALGVYTIGTLYLIYFYKGEIHCYETKSQKSTRQQRSFTLFYL